jgi:hypothetical protein
MVECQYTPLYVDLEINPLTLYNLMIDPVLPVKKKNRGLEIPCFSCLFPSHSWLGHIVSERAARTCHAVYL